jgi:predicted Zn-dependent protease
MRRLLALAAALALPAPPTIAADLATPAADPTLYRPVDADERGLWMQMDEAERAMRTSPMVIRDPALNAYVRSVLCKVTGEDRCHNIRLYIVRTADFNAAMAPNGMLEVWSGLLLRVQNEAQLAAAMNIPISSSDTACACFAMPARRATPPAGWRCCRSAASSAWEF